MNQAYIEQGIQPLPTEWRVSVRSKSASAFEQFTRRPDPIFDPGGMEEYETQMAEFLEKREDLPTAKKVSFTLQPALLIEAQAIAQREHITISEIFREALRRYIAATAASHPEWKALLQRARARGASHGITSEADIKSLSDEYRAEGKEEMVDKWDGKAAVKLGSIDSGGVTARRVGGQNLLGITYIAPDFDEPMSEEDLKEWGY